VDTNVVSMTTVLSAVIAAFTWNITPGGSVCHPVRVTRSSAGLCGARLQPLAAMVRDQMERGVWPKCCAMIHVAFAGFISAPY